MSDKGTKSTEDLVHLDGEAHCPNEECDWWVPEGMEYLFDSHDCDTYGSEEISTEEIVKIVREDRNER